jgi:hypothetical protein
MVSLEYLDGETLKPLLESAVLVDDPHIVRRMCLEWFWGETSLSPDLMATDSRQAKIWSAPDPS